MKYLISPPDGRLVPWVTVKSDVERVINMLLYTMTWCFYVSFLSFQLNQSGVCSVAMETDQLSPVWGSVLYATR